MEKLNQSNFFLMNVVKGTCMDVGKGTCDFKFLIVTISYDHFTLNNKDKIDN